MRQLKRAIALLIGWSAGLGLARLLLHLWPPQVCFPDCGTGMADLFVQPARSLSALGALLLPGVLTTRWQRRRSRAPTKSP